MTAFLLFVSFLNFLDFLFSLHSLFFNSFNTFLRFIEKVLSFDKISTVIVNNFHEEIFKLNLKEKRFFFSLNKVNFKFIVNGNGILDLEKNIPWWCSAAFVIWVVWVGGMDGWNGWVEWMDGWVGYWILMMAEFNHFDGICS